MFKRNLLYKLNKYLSLFPCVLLTGVRQAGKTTLSRLARPDWRYFDLENISDRELITSDIPLFFRENDTSIILDEVQLVPEVLAYLRGLIDQKRAEKNRFILTGSSSPELLKVHAETLAGRSRLLEVSPLSMSEQVQIGLSPFFGIFEGKLSEHSISIIQDLAIRISDEQFKNSWLKGGFPETITIPNNSLSIWQENYISTYLERDIRRYFPGLNFDNFSRFIISLQDYHAQQINVAEFSRLLSLSESSVRRYLEIANGMFFWRELRSIERTVLRSITKQPKGFYRDSGLFHFLSRIHDYDDLFRSKYRGASFEAFVIEELIRGISCTLATNVDYRFVRTRGGLEVDLVIDGSFGRLPVEIKCASSNTIKDVSGLKAFIEREDLPLGVVINQAQRIALLSDKIVQVPITVL